MGGEAGLRQARNAHSTLGSHEIVGQFPFHAGYAAWHIVVAKQPAARASKAMASGAGVKLRLKPGTSNWTGALSTRMRLDAPFGLATTGQ
jgi:hypothetical protein